MPQLVPSQVAWPFAAGLGQAEQRVPQLPGSVLALHTPLQLCAVDGQPPHTSVLGMQAPLHSC